MVHSFIILTHIHLILIILRVRYVLARAAIGRDDFQLQGLKFALNEEEKHRLFGISLRGFVFELDLASLTMKNVRDSYGGNVWCMALSPRDPYFSVGCEDGTVRIYNYSNNQLELHKTLPSTGSRVLCMAYHPSEPRIYLGLTDSTIRCIDETTGRSIYRMTGDIFRGSPAYIWSITVLKDSTVISGDGRGNVQIWDGNVGVLMVNIRQHTAEILSIVASVDETKIFASGVDGRVTCIRKIEQSVTDTISNGDATCGDAQWVYTSSHNPHTHDVHALSICQVKGKERECLVSGGIDSKLCVYSVQDFVKVRPSWILPVPVNGLLQHSSSYNMISIRHSSHIDIWKGGLAIEKLDEVVPVTKKSRKKGNIVGKEVESVSNTHSSGEIKTGATDESYKLQLRIEANDPSHIHTSALSSDGKLLIYSSVSGTRLWLLGCEARVTLHTIQLPPEIKDVLCQSLVFSNDCKHLAAYVGTTGQLVVLDINVDSLTAGVWHVFDHTSSVYDAIDGRNSSNDRNNSRFRTRFGLEHVGNNLCFSYDGSYLAVMDAMNCVYIYEMDRLRLHWRLPDFPAPVTLISFHPESTSSLVVLLASNVFIIFDVDNMCITPWSRDNLDKIPAAVKNLEGPIEGITFNSQLQSFFVYGQGFCVYVDIASGIPEIPNTVITSTVTGNNAGKKRRKKNKSNSSSNNNFSIINRFRSIIHFASISNSNLVSNPSFSCLPSSH